MWGDDSGTGMWNSWNSFPTEKEQGIISCALTLYRWIHACLAWLLTEPNFAHIFHDIRSEYDRNTSDRHEQFDVINVIQTAQTRTFYVYPPSNCNGVSIHRQRNRLSGQSGLGGARLFKVTDHLVVLLIYLITPLQCKKIYPIILHTNFYTSICIIIYRWFVSNWKDVCISTFIILRKSSK